MSADEFSPMQGMQPGIHLLVRQGKEAVSVHLGPPLNNGGQWRGFKAMEYAIPSESSKHLQVGKWVEIFNACAKESGQGPIRVHIMRVEGRVLVFGKRCSGLQGAKPLRPHEGEVISIDQRPKEVRFRIRMDS